MPKHVPTFKHLIHTSQQPQRPTAPSEKSVTDLLASSRLQHSRSASTGSARDAPPHMASGSTSNAVSSGERIWSPNGSSSGAVGGLIDVEQGGIHPAELLRRSQISQRQASRSVAGPAPPPSWRSPSNAAASSSKTTQTTPSRPRSPVTSGDLHRSLSLFSPSSHSRLESNEEQQSNSTGRSRLVEFCFQAVLRHLEDETIIYEASDDFAEDGKYKGGSEASLTETYSIGSVLREQVCYLDTHLKVGLLEAAAMLPESHQARLSDRSFLAILGEPPPEIDLGDEGDNTQESHTSSWEDAPIGPSLSSFAHLSITIHAAPHALLRQVSAELLHGLTSLNLAYSTVPNDMEKLVAILPSGLRELGLAGVKFGAKGVVGAEVLRRGFASLGRKMIVLRMLDLSYPRYDLNSLVLAALLHPVSKLPSLRLLGLRGVMDGLPPDPDHTGIEDGPPKTGNHIDSAQEMMMESAKKEWANVIKGGGRTKYIEVVW